MPPSMIKNMPDELTLYDRTRDELRRRFGGKFPADFDLEDTITAYAYWVCTVMRNHGKDWESAVQQYVDSALRDAFLERQAEQVELELLHRELRQVAGLFLDVGAGWGRFGFLYEEFGLKPVYVEPSSLGCRLLRRNNLAQSVRCLGQGLSFPARIFNGVVIGWVLHHNAPEVPADNIMKEVARVTVPGGRLISIEPLSADFDSQQWREMVERAGYTVERLECFFNVTSSAEKSEQYASLTAIRQPE